MPLTSLSHAVTPALVLHVLRARRCVAVWTWGAKSWRVPIGSA